MRRDDLLRLLVISESWNEAEVLTNHLRNAGHIVRPLRVEDEGRLTMALRDQDWDLLLYLPDALALEVTTVLDLLSDSRKDIPVIVVADDLSPQQKLEVLEAGAQDVVPNEPPGLLQKVVRREVEGLRLRHTLHACQNDLREAERRCRMLLDNARDAIAYVQEGMHILANPAYLQVFRFADADEVIGVPLLDVVSPEAHLSLKDLLRIADRPGSEVQSLKIQALRTDGESFSARFEFTPAVLDGESCIQVVVHDLSPTAELQEQINNLTRRDSLTGLYNRQYFLQELERTLPSHPGVVYLTVDNLAVLRGKVGIAGADRVLKEVALLITRHVQASDLVASFGDGVFTLLTTEGEESRLRTLVEGIRKALSNCLIEVEGVTVSASSSVGLHPSYLHAKDSRTLLSRVEAAATAAREGGSKGIVVCKPEGTNAKRLATAEAGGNLLRMALEQNQLFLAYQPIVYLRGDGREIYEVSLRLIGPNGEQSVSEQVMQSRDDPHLSVAIDRWVVSRALEVIVERRSRGGKPVRLLLGISRGTLLDETFPAWLGENLKSSNIPAASLVLQTYDVLAVDHYLRVRDLILLLRNLGCSFSLAHCQGDEEVSSQLRQLDADYFKIDGNLIQDLATNHDHQVLVRTFNEQIHALGKYTLAESVRDANTLSLLWQYGVDYIQGEYLQKPSSVMDYDFSSLFLE
ncbi:multidomain signaling protein FimX [Gammaproteobacteria bacterium]